MEDEERQCGMEAGPFLDVIALLFLVVLLTSQTQRIESADINCYDACSTGCVQKDPRLMSQEMLYYLRSRCCWCCCWSWIINHIRTQSISANA